VAAFHTSHDSVTASKVFGLAVVPLWLPPQATSTPLSKAINKAFDFMLSP